MKATIYIETNHDCDVDTLQNVVRKALELGVNELIKIGENDYGNIVNEINDNIPFVGVDEDQDYD